MKALTSSASHTDHSFATLSAGNRRESAAALTKQARAYYLVFLLALIICWSPSNAAAYLAPFLVIGAYVALSNSERALVRTLLWFLGSLFLIVGYGLLYRSGYAWQSALISILTYSAFAVPAVIPASAVANEALWRKMLTVCRWMLLIQATLGIVQSFYGYSQIGSFSGAIGDHVEGTIHPWLESERSFSNPMFAVNVTLLLLAIAPSVLRERKGWLAFGLGAVSLILASVLHVLIVLAAAVAVSVLFFFPTFLVRYRVGCLTSAVAGIVLILSITILDWGPLVPFVQATRNLETPRSIVIRGILRDMPGEYPFFPWIGLGPGQFSSRAGLIGTGLYFGRPDAPKSLPLLTPGRSAAFRQFVEGYWLDTPIREGFNSSTNNPFFSWQSLYTEFGAAGVLVVVGMVMWLAVQMKRRANTVDKKILAMFTGAGVLFVVFLGIQENYWEVPQAILPGLMLLKVQYSLVCDGFKPQSPDAHVAFPGFHRSQESHT